MILIFILLSLFESGKIEKENFLKMADKKAQIKSFLKNISQVESSGGKDYSHDLIQSGIHAGDKAIGRYGLMPNTVSEVLNRMKISGTITPELEKLKTLDHPTLKQTLETNPELEDQIAEALAGKVLDRQQDEEKAAYSWHQGHNLTPDKVSQKYKNNDYVKKYNELKKLTGDENVE